MVFSPSNFQVVVDGRKFCSLCHKLKDLEEFTPDKRVPSGRQAACKACNVLTQARIRTPEIARHRNLKQKYGISYSQYEEMYKNQDGKCAICKSSFEVLYVDHCHDSKKIRGLLCGNCNLGIGNLQDNIQLLQNAIEYLKEWKKDGSSS